MHKTEFAKGPLMGLSYWDQAVFEAERRSLFATQPLFVDAESALAEVGEFRRIGIGDDSLVVVRGRDSAVRSFANLCVHRGFPLVEQPSGARRALVCRYHGWRYDPEGRLTDARGLPSPACSLRLGLAEMPCVTSAGLVITSQQPLNPVLVGDMTALFTGLGLPNARVVAEDVFIARTNWKLWVENFLECWHCAPNHPELAATESHVRLFEAEDYRTYSADCAAMRRRAAQGGFALPLDQEIDPADPVFHFWEVAPLGGGRLSPCLDGRRLGPALASEAMEGLFVYGSLGPFLHFSIAVDHAVIFSFLPMTAEQTEIRTTWLARAAVNRDALTWLWTRTLAQDRSLTETLHESVKSRHYRGGQYLPHEERAARFTTWLANRQGGPGTRIDTGAPVTITEIQPWQHLPMPPTESETCRHGNPLNGS